MPKDAISDTASSVLANWGEPRKVKKSKEGIELWYYADTDAAGSTKTIWKGAVPFLLIPIPLLVPTGPKDVILHIDEGKVVLVETQWKSRSGGVCGMVPDGRGFMKFGCTKA